jgi:hypothetical protein
MTQAGTFPAGKSYPFDPGSGQQAGNAEYRHMGAAYGDGIVNDVAGNAFAASASASSRVITVNLNELRLRGIHFEKVDDTVDITLSTPSSGYTRADRIVAHYDPADKSVAIVKHEGAAVNSGTPAPPALHRNAGGTWDLPLWRFTGGTGAASTLTKLDERTWIGWQGFAANKDCLPDVAPVGSQFLAIDTGHRWRRMFVSGSPAWVDADAPTIANISLPSSVAASGVAPGVALLNGVIYGRGSWVRSPAGLFVVGGGGADNLYSLGNLPSWAWPSVGRSFIVGRLNDAGSGGITVRIDITTGGVISAAVSGPAGASGFSRIRADNIVYPVEG